MRGALDCFSSSYAEARSKFRDAAERSGAEPKAYVHPLTGPDGGVLATDVAYLGKRDTEKLLILVSGTHGLELLTGSGCQTAWLDERGADDLPDDVALLLIHAINPWGAAWTRRQTEDNVDLNRNFLDFSAPLPANPGYLALGDAIESAGDAPDALIRAFRHDRDERAFDEAVYKGQYSHPKGLFYGGSAATWSNRTFYRILDDHARPAKHIALIDYHTGLGPYGYGVLIATSEDKSVELETTRAWYGPSVAALKAENSMPYDIRGDLMAAPGAYMPDALVISAALEFGTFGIENLFDQLVAEMRAYHQGSAEGRAALQRFFHPGTADWLEMVHWRSRQVIRQSLVGLSAIV